ncbi:hypothetical protein ACFXGA_10080 [Actinosynnema sp. NPDC059335]|uniref:hypothetical protein n=1 Tax=Actinosynnema sp. NPDC059335 TaxID=3346804 RepID=UPI003670ADDB
MRRLSPLHVALSVNAACAGANLVLAVVWSSWVLALAGAGWALVAAWLFAFREDGDSGPDAAEAMEERPEEPLVLPRS